HRYLDDDPTATHQDDYQILVTVTEQVDDGADPTSTTRATLTIENVAPVLVDLTIDETAIDENDVITIAGRVTDIGTLDTHVVEIDWGDGTGSVAVVDHAHPHLHGEPRLRGHDGAEQHGRSLHRHGAGGRRARRRRHEDD
ncbi:hypothetical protein, partial [Rhodoplanes sp. SY1]|uniref:hypothetical protein n=1 Tax=Rhodoplanes sp. SY1 TaxID=3166646 RepID=UPI0038B56DD8